MNKEDLLTLLNELGQNIEALEDRLLNLKNKYQQVQQYIDASDLLIWNKTSEELPDSDTEIMVKSPDVYPHYFMAMYHADSGNYYITNTMAWMEAGLITEWSYIEPFSI